MTLLLRASGLPPAPAEAAPSRSPAAKFMADSTPSKALEPSGRSPAPATTAGRTALPMDAKSRALVMQCWVGATLAPPQAVKRLPATATARPTTWRIVKQWPIVITKLPARWIMLWSISRNVLSYSVVLVVTPPCQRCGPPRHPL